MVRLYVTENSEGLAFHDGGLTIFMVGMIAASISMMAIVIFACAKSSAKRKNKNNPYSDGGGGGAGNKTFAKTVVIGENKVRKIRATSAPVRSTGEILVSTAETVTTVVDIPSADDVCNNNDDCVKDTRCHDGHSSKNNDVSTDRTDNNNNMSASHTHVSANNTTSGGDGHHHDNTSGNTGGGWSNDHGGSSWGGGDHGGGGFSGGGDTGGFSGGGW